MLDFIYYRLLIRPLVALVGPLIFYSIGFAIAKLFPHTESIKYFNNYAIIVMLFISIIYPINKIGLIITLKPIEMIIDWTLKRTNDTSNQFAFKGNYRPIEKDIMHHIAPEMILQGTIPTEINGVFLRNGPNPLYVPSHGRHHWFDGDGRIHGFRIKDGQAYYCTKQTQTPNFKAKMKYKRLFNDQLGTLTHAAGIIMGVLYELERDIGYIPKFKDFQAYSANTAIAHHSKRTFALVEADLPFQV